jgi:hypothetical protein
MRQPVGDVAEFSNLSWPSNSNLTLAMSLDILFSCPIGIPANFIVIYLSFFSSHINGEFKYFIGNLAVCDLLFCFTLLFQSMFHIYHRAWNLPMTLMKCTIQSGLTYGAGPTAGFALPLATINRYLVVVQSKDEWFSRRNILLMCMTSYIPMLLPVIVLAFATQVIDYPYCGFALYVPWVIESSLAITIVVAYPIVMFCNFSLFRVLSQHMSTVTKNLKKSVAEVKNERSLLKAIVAQGWFQFFSNRKETLKFWHHCYNSTNLLTFITF